MQVASGGRAVCGVGKGDSSGGRVGRSPQRHDDFVHDLRALCAYLSGGSIELHGVESRLAWLEKTDYRPVPVEVAATGPRSLAAAAAHADRISLAVGADAGRIRWALESASLDPLGVQIGCSRATWRSKWLLQSHQALQSALEILQNRTSDALKPLLGLTEPLENA